MPAYADDFLLKINAENRRLVAILAPVIIGSILGTNMLITPMFKKIKTMEFEKTGYSEKETVYKNILEWEKKILPYRTEEDKEFDKTALIEQLNSMAGKSGLIILSISPDEKKVSLANIESMLIRIDSEGNYHQLAEFISLAESFKTHTRITSFEINRDSAPDVTTGISTSARNKTYKISLALTVYFGMKG